MSKRVMKYRRIIDKNANKEYWIACYWDGTTRRLWSRPDTRGKKVQMERITLPVQKWADGR